MTDLVGAVRAEHARILDAVQQLGDYHARRPLREHAARRALHEVITLESRHEVAEARVLWPVVRDLMPELSEVREAALIQEKWARRQLHRLLRARTTAEIDEWTPRVIQAVRSHIGLEESQVLNALEATLPRSVALSLGPLFERISASAPTRPHPHTPAVPGVLAAVGPLARRVDRFRDFLHLP